MKNSIVLDKNQGKITFNEYEIQMHKEGGIYEMYIRCQDNEMLDCIIGHITSGIQERSYGEEFLSHVKVENLYKMDAKQILLFAKMDKEVQKELGHKIEKYEKKAQMKS